MSDRIMVYKISDGQGSEAYFEYDENVMRVVGGFVEFAEPNQKMVVETVEVTYEELQKLPRGW